jgi:hypothetical protein
MPRHAIVALINMQPHHTHTTHDGLWLPMPESLIHTRRLARRHKRIQTWTVGGASMPPPLDQRRCCHCAPCSFYSILFMHTRTCALPPTPLAPGWRLGHCYPGCPRWGRHTQTHMHTHTHVHTHTCAHKHTCAHTYTCTHAANTHTHANACPAHTYAHARSTRMPHTQPPTQPPNPYHTFQALVPPCTHACTPCTHTRIQPRNTADPPIRGMATHLDNFVLQHTHARFLHCHFGKRDTSSICGFGRSLENSIHL